MVSQSRLTQRQWLNIMIIAISFLIFIFIFLGKAMNREELVDKTQDYQLVKIDFANVEIYKNEKAIWKTHLTGYESNMIVNVGKRWENLLQSPILKPSQKPLQIALGKTVLLYFLNHTQPVVCKIKMNNNDLLVTFVASQKQVIIQNATMKEYYLE